MTLSEDAYSRIFQGDCNGIEGNLDHYFSEAGLLAEAVTSDYSSLTSYQISYPIVLKCSFKPMALLCHSH